MLITTHPSSWYVLHEYTIFQLNHLFCKCKFYMSLKNIQVAAIWKEDGKLKKLCTNEIHVYIFYSEFRVTIIKSNQKIGRCYISYPWRCLFILSSLILMMHFYHMTYDNVNFVSLIFFFSL